LLIIALFVLPLFSIIDGRSWWTAELFGFTPDATVLATMALLCLIPGRKAWLLMIIPTTWCLISGVTMWVLELPYALLMPAAAVAMAMCRTKSTYLNPT
jgi:hypothetical protein